MRPQALARPLVAAALAAVCVLALAPVASAGSSDQQALHQARQDLRETKADIRARAAKLRAIQRDLNQLATEIGNDESAVEHANVQIQHLERELSALEARSLTLQHRLGARDRTAYILGPGAPVLYLLTATSAADAANRMSIITEMNRRDQVLADQVARNDERLDRTRAEVARTVRAKQLALQRLKTERADLQAKLAASRRLFAELQVRKQQALATISRYHPFQVCPVDGPVAIANNFGVWVHRSERWGGDHIHEGNDMMAAYGTPIVAPFDGTAVVATNKIGGLAVKVLGRYGYVYNAHLSRFGQLGPVHAGDVIGYVGNTGDTNANHDHFEWHPGNGAAVDPNPFLLQVC